MVKVFISGTYLDLKEYRQAVLEQLNFMRHHSVEMTYFGSTDKDAIALSLEELENCDVYLGIIGHRYGTVLEGETRSITHCEYERAYELYKQGRMRLILYLADEEHVHLPIKFYETPEERNKQKEFQKLLKQRHVSTMFKSPQELALKVATDLPRLMQEKDLKTSSVIRIFDIGEDDLKSVYEAVDSTIQERVYTIESFLLFIAESFGSLFKFDPTKLNSHPFFKEVKERLYILTSGIHLKPDNGILVRTGVRHVILRTETLIPLMQKLDSNQLLSTGRDIGRGAALDLIEKTLKSKKFVPASPQAFVSLWDFWESTGGWGKLSFIIDNYESCVPSQAQEGTHEPEWYIKVENNFLRVHSPDETGKLCNFWCGYIHGFLEVSLPQIDDLMADLDEKEKANVNLPPYRQVEAVIHCEENNNESIFRVRLKKRIFSEAIELLSDSKRRLRQGDNRVSMMLSRDAVNSAKSVAGIDFEEWLNGIQLPVKSGSILEQMKTGNISSATNKTAKDWFEVANLLIQRLSQDRE